MRGFFAALRMTTLNAALGMTTLNAALRMTTLNAALKVRMTALKNLSQNDEI
jgi:hypothetical protein